MKNYWLDRKLDREWKFPEDHEFSLTKCGYPQDDDNSLMQWSAGNANLDAFYGSMFYQNEEVSNYGVGYVDYMFTHTPILENSLIGEIFIGEDKVYTFDSHFNLTLVKESEFEIIGNLLDLTTGELYTYWNKTPNKEVKIFASYETPRCPF